jgi:hypothetical protein
MTPSERLAAIEKMVALLPFLVSDCMQMEIGMMKKPRINLLDVRDLIAGLSALQGVADGSKTIVPLDKSGLGNQTGI